MSDERCENCQDWSKDDRTCHLGSNDDIEPRFIYPRTGPRDRCDGFHVPAKRRLWDINQDLLILAEESVDPETGEVLEDISERFAQIAGEREDKIVAWACYIKGERIKADVLRAEERRISEEAVRILDRSKAKDAAADRSQRRLALLLNSGERIEQPAAVVKWHKQQDKLEVVPDLLLRQWKRQPPIPELAPDKVEIRKELKAGTEIAGAKLVPQPDKLIIE